MKNPIRTRNVVFALSLLVLTVGWWDLAQAEPRRGSRDSSDLQGHWILGARAGFGLWTQQIDPAIDSENKIGPALNFQALYGLTDWIALGLMLEWERRSVEGLGFRYGSLNTVSLLPTVEVHPLRYGAIDPYFTASMGVNVNSFGEAAAVPPTSFSNTFAFRLGGGVDYMLTDRLGLNTEVAWKRNRGGVESQGVDYAWDASSWNFLFGVRYKF